MNRNLYPPEHLQSQWIIQISEDHAVGQVIETISGRDNDTKVSAVTYIYCKYRNDYTLKMKFDLETKEVGLLVDICQDICGVNLFFLKVVDSKMLHVLEIFLLHSVGGLQSYAAMDVSVVGLQKTL